MFSSQIRHHLCLQCRCCSLLTFFFSSINSCVYSAQHQNCFFTTCTCRDLFKLSQAYEAHERALSWETSPRAWLANVRAIEMENGLIPVPASSGFPVDGLRGARLNELLISSAPTKQLPYLSADELLPNCLESTAWSRTYHLVIVSLRVRISIVTLPHLASGCSASPSNARIRYKISSPILSNSLSKTRHVLRAIRQQS